MGVGALVVVFGGCKGFGWVEGVGTYLGQGVGLAGAGEVEEFGCEVEGFGGEVGDGFWIVWLGCWLGRRLALLCGLLGWFLVLWDAHGCGVCSA